MFAIETSRRIQGKAYQAANWTMRKPLLVILASALLAAAGQSSMEPSSRAPSTPGNEVHAPTPSYLAQGTSEVEALGSTTFVEQGLEHLESPFTKETVLELNAIVERSLLAIREFDVVRQGLLSDGAEPNDTHLRVHEGLSQQAAVARCDMAAASDRLRRSREPYNEEILAAMIHFVDHVDEEIRAELERLTRPGASSTK